MTNQTIHPRYFRFENDFVVSLRCVPMIVRYHLDAVRIKLQLSEWAQFSVAEKELLARLPCGTETEIMYYAQVVNQLVFKYNTQWPKALNNLSDTWNASCVPLEVIDKCAEWKCTPPDGQQWAQLDVLEKFALVKLSRSGHEGKNLPLALHEFGVTSGEAPVRRSLSKI